MAVTVAAVAQTVESLSRATVAVGGRGNIRSRPRSPLWTQKPSVHSWKSRARSFCSCRSTPGAQLPESVFLVTVFSSQCIALHIPHQQVRLQTVSPGQIAFSFRFASPWQARFAWDDGAGRMTFSAYCD